MIASGYHRVYNKLYHGISSFPVYKFLLLKKQKTAPLEVMRIAQSYEGPNVVGVDPRVMGGGSRIGFTTKFHHAGEMDLVGY